MDRGVMRIAESTELCIGSEVIDLNGYRGIVVKIIIGDTIEDHGTVYVWQMSRTNYGIDNCEHYPYSNWPKFFHIIK